MVNHSFACLPTYHVLRTVIDNGEDNRDVRIASLVELFSSRIDSSSSLNRIILLRFHLIYIYMVFMVVFVLQLYFILVVYSQKLCVSCV